MSRMSELDNDLREASTIVDLNWITDGTADRCTLEAVEKRRNRRVEDELELFRRNMHHAFNYAEAALDNCRVLARNNYRIFNELEEVETYVRGLLLAVMLQQRAHTKQDDHE